MDELDNDIFNEHLSDAFSTNADSEQLHESFTSETDPLGSYTGNNSLDPYSQPEQDVDDL